MVEGRAVSAVPEEATLQARSAGRRIYQLDALRGLAAVIVVAHHTRLAEHRLTPPWALAPLFAGPQVVVLFFVLSGFVLTLPHLQGRSQPYKVYAVRRLTRLYLPFAAAAVLSVVVSLPFRNEHLPLTPWFAAHWNCDVTWRAVLTQLTMWPMECFNTALWSIWFEMQFSLLMPFLVRAMLRWNSGTILACSLAAAFVDVSLVSHLERYMRLGLSLQVGSLFVLGTFLALHEQTLRRWLRSIGKHAWWIFLLSLILFFEYPCRLSTRLESRSWLVAGIGAAGILVCSLEMKALSDLLRHKVAEYLGRISFSLYLLHSILVMLFFDLLYGKVPSFIIYLAIALSSLVSAHFFCIWLEEPCIQLAKCVGTLKTSGRRLRPVSLKPG